MGVEKFDIIPPSPPSDLSQANDLFREAASLWPLIRDIVGRRNCVSELSAVKIVSEES